MTKRIEPERFYARGTVLLFVMVVICLYDIVSFSSWYALLFVLLMPIYFYFGIKNYLINKELFKRRS